MYKSAKAQVRHVPVSVLVNELEERLSMRGWGQCAVAEKCFVRSHKFSSRDFLEARLAKRGYSPEQIRLLLRDGALIAEEVGHLANTLRRIENVAYANREKDT